jgi:hypothetical protein
MANKTGEKCGQSGIYKSQCHGQEVALSRGDTFPPCQECRHATTWILVRPTKP